VYDSTNSEDPSAWANGSYYFGDLQITTDPAIRLTGISKLPASDGILRPEPDDAVPRDNTMLDLHFVAPLVNFGQYYSLYVKRNDLLNPTPLLSNLAVDAGEMELSGGGNIINGVAIPGAFPHFTDENIQYTARGINNQGYVVEATALITFTP
jgi:hypothetical protein